MASDMKVALITGAGSGVGRAAALALHKAGYSIVLAGRRAEQLQETVELAEASEPRMLCVPTDIAQPEQIRALFATTKEAFGRLDVLFNNAGIGAPRIPMEELKLEDWQQVVDVNMTGSFVCAQEAIKIMKDQTPKGGRIINNGSVSAHSPRPDSIAYTSTKHAMTGMTKSISLDCRKHDIVASQLDIGNADTPLASRFKEGVPQANGEIKVEPVFDVAHCGSAIVYMAELPLDANVQFMTIMATKMPYIGRG